MHPKIVGKYREGDIRHCVADISRAQKLLNYSPKVSLEEGLPALLSWVKKQNSVDMVEKASAELSNRGLVK